VDILTGEIAVKERLGASALFNRQTLLFDFFMGPHTAVQCCAVQSQQSGGFAQAQGGKGITHLCGFHLTG